MSTPPPNAAIAPGGLSPDNAWVWNGVEWVHWSQAHFSPDRAYIWDGTQWARTGGSPPAISPQTSGWQPSKKTQSHALRNAGIIIGAILVLLAVLGKAVGTNSNSSSAPVATNSSTGQVAPAPTQIAASSAPINCPAASSIQVTTFPADFPNYPGALLVSETNEIPRKDNPGSNLFVRTWSSSDRIDQIIAFFNACLNQGAWMVTAENHQDGWDEIRFRRESPRISGYLSVPLPDNQNATQGQFNAAIFIYFATSTIVPSSAPVAPKVLLDKAGSGISKTAIFNTPREWEINYSFDCTNFGFKGNFQIYVYDGTGALKDIPVNALALKGSDISYEHNLSGPYYLQINSECNWHVIVKG